MLSRPRREPSAIVVQSGSWSEVAGAWEALAREASSRSFFSMPESVEAWLETFAATLTCELLLFRERDQVIGACMLVRRTIRRGPFVIRRVFLNTAGEDVEDSACIEFNELLCRPGYERRMASALRAHLDDERDSWDELQVAGMLEGASLDALREAFDGCTVSDQAAPSYHVELDGQRDYVQRYRQNIRPYRKHGGIVLDEAATPSEANAFLDELAALHQKRWISRGKPGAFASPTFRAYHRALIDRSFATGRIQLLRLRAGAAVIGYHYNFLLDGKLYFYQCGYDYELDEKASPGFAMQAYAIRHAAARGITDYDLMAGDVEYKRRLGTGARVMHWTTWQAPTVKMKTFDLARNAIREWRAGSAPAQLVKKVGQRLRRELGIGMQEMIMYRADVAQPTDELRIERVTEPALLDAIGPSDHAQWTERWNRGDRCYGAFIDDMLVHYSWVQASGTHEVTGAGRSFAVKPGEFWIYDCRTAEAHRGKRIYPRTLRFVVADYLREGARTGWIYVKAENIASQHGIVRAGFVETERLRAVHLGRHYRAV